MRLLYIFPIVAAISACTPLSPGTLSPTPGTVSPGPQTGDPATVDTQATPYRVLDSINALRRSNGQSPVALSAELNAAAKTHAQDMAAQNRAWHFGSDGSSPIDRVRRVGYAGTLLGENISESYEGDYQTVTAWMSAPETRGVVLDQRAADIGVGVYQQGNGKLWWVLLTGARTGL